MCTRAILKVAWICQKRRENRLSLEDHGSESNLPWRHTSSSARLTPEWLPSGVWHNALARCEFAEVTEMKCTLCIQGILSSSSKTHAYEEFYEHVITNFSEGFSFQNDCDLLRQSKWRWSNEPLSLHASSFQTTNTVSISTAQWKTSERLFYGFIKLHWYKYPPSIPHELFQLNALISILVSTIKMIKHLLWLV